MDQYKCFQGASFGRTSGCRTPGSTDLSSEGYERTTLLSTMSSGDHREEASSLSQKAACPFGLQTLGCAHLCKYSEDTGMCLHTAPISYAGTI